MRRSTATAAPPWIWNCWTGCSSTPTEESHYADADYARAGYGYFVRDLTHSATTRACIFGTLHTDATLELMHQLKAAGLSAFVGKLGMDRNSPDFYRESSPAAGRDPPLAGHLCRRAYATTARCAQ